MDFIKRNKRRFLLYMIDITAYAGIFALVAFAGYLTTGSVDVWKHIYAFAVFVCTITASRLVFTIYSNVWRYANCRAYIEMVCADMIGGAAGLIVTVLLRGQAYIGIWQEMATVCAFSLATLGMRFLYQEACRYNSQDDVKSAGSKEKIAILGAGRIGALFAEELLCYDGSIYEPMFFIDVDRSKVGNRVVGLPVVADGEAAVEKIKQYGVKEVIVTIPQLSMEKARKIFEYYGQCGCKIKVYDYPINADSEQKDKRVIRDIKIEDLLFRDTIKPMDEAAKKFYRGKVILVTGGGGSIGSELCRQIAKCRPEKLVIFDIYENNAYDIQQELSRRYSDRFELVVEIGSVRDRARLEGVFAAHRPHIVFHAAAHKHVPLMERSNGEAIKNNVFGTYNTADMAEKYGAQKFILISTDKAVNPTNVMGATPRMCEMVIRCRNDSQTSFSAVRFGNVLGSNGSVIPLFRRQIEAGGPVTITDKRIVRYFMTIPEASGLVMQAGAMAKRGELFVLDMGKPVRILDLAVNMIRFSGFEPYSDIAIEEIGLRPGEKLYEELLVNREQMQRTDNDLIFVEKEELLTREDVEEKLRILREAVENYGHDMPSCEITEALRSVVPTFHSPDEVNCIAESSAEMQDTNELAHV